MTVPKEYVNKPYRQIADTLRWKRGRQRIASVRPIDDKNTHYTDIETPTIVRFQAKDERVDVLALLQQGAIAEYQPAAEPTSKTTPAVRGEEEGERGRSPSQPE